MTKHKKRSRGSTRFFQGSRSSEIVREVIGEIRRGKTFLVTTHENPDGDALGSALALAAGLKKLGKKVKVYNKDRPPSSLKFLPHVERVIQELQVEERFDVAFIVDCADLDRVGEGFARHPGIGKKIVIDHHLLSGRAGDINLIVKEAASTGVIVYHLLKGLRIPITKEIAIAIYCTLVTDTGSFRYSNTDASVLELASELVSLGVRPWLVSKNLFDNYPVARLKLLGKVLNTLEVSPDGKIASLTLTGEMLRETGATSDLAEEFINFARSIDSVEVAVFIREFEDGFKISLRSKDFVDVATLASRFGGGGHKRAAGLKMKGTLPEVQSRILEAARAAIP